MSFGNEWVSSQGWGSPLIKGKVISYYLNNQFGLMKIKKRFV